MVGIYLVGICLVVTSLPRFSPRAAMWDSSTVLYRFFRQILFFSYSIHSVLLLSCNRLQARKLLMANYLLWLMMQIHNLSSPSPYTYICMYYKNLVLMTLFQMITTDTKGQFYSCFLISNAEIITCEDSVSFMIALQIDLLSVYVSSSI